MSNVRVTETVTQIFDGQQGDITLINQGPSTAYLESNSSLSTYNALPLPPLASLVWRAGSPLFAATAGGVTDLTVSTGAGLIDAARVSVQRLVYTSINETITDRFETGAYQTLIVRGDYVPDPPGVAVDPWFFDWYDETGELLSTERIVIWRRQGLYTANVPVRGASCRIRYGLNILIPESDVKIFGTTRTFGATFQSQIPIWQSGINYDTVQIDRGAILVEQFNQAILTPCWIPCWGNRLSISILTQQQANEKRFELEDMDGATYGSLVVPAIGAVTNADYYVTRDFIVPTSKALRLGVNRNSALPTSVTFVWADF